LADHDALMTRHEAARVAGVTFNTILLWIRAGRLHPVAEPARGRRVIRLSELEGIIDETSSKRQTMQIWAGAKAVEAAPPSST